MKPASFETFLAQLLGGNTRPHCWQARLAADPVCRNRLIRIPTGFGKTAGVALAWLWNRVCQGRDDWPRRLVFCLPMRTLVEQTEREVQLWVDRAQLFPQPKVHVLMGGLSPSDWHLEPDQNAVLIGTQDMLLSRALNRGYGSGRARWPMEYGLLNVDCLWVMDEIQLMDVGLATCSQLQGFADDHERGNKLPRPRRTWWMSATLQRDWLTRASALGDVNSLPMIELEPQERAGPLWTVEKPVRVTHLPAAGDPRAQQWADVVANAHKGGISLAITNTVKSAVDLHVALKKLRNTKRLSEATELRLVHSRFRGAERRQWANEFLSREYCKPDQNRIIVATQVVEAGVDISADVLVTELAPWASLVQRFGRCARYGGQGQIMVIDRRHSDESAQKLKAKDNEERSSKRQDEDRKTTRPYELAEIEAAAEAMTNLGGAAGPSALGQFEKSEEEKNDGGILARLYPYQPLHVLTRRELLDLFDTGPDLTGADIDIARFVREGDERDVTIWWWPVPQNQRSPHPRLRPMHDALCRVPVHEMRDWLLARKQDADDRQPEADGAAPASKNPKPRAWVWSYLDGNWARIEERHIYPGQTILVDASGGGYDICLGFTGKPGSIPVEAEHARGMSPSDAADEADEQEDLSEGLGDSSRQYKTIATHVAEVSVQGQKIAQALGLTGSAIQKIIELVGVVHDIGKAHPVFVGAIRDRNGIAAGTPLAKAPKGRWHGVLQMYNYSHLGERPGFRHELASTLALIELLWRARPDHQAIHGGREAVLDITVGRELPEGSEKIVNPNGIIAELTALDETSLNLVLYLVMCHHGKVRATLPMSPRDQENPGRDGILPIRGVRDNDEIPALVLANPAGEEFQVPMVKLRLDPARLGLSKRYGPSWVERVLSLREHYGIFQLAWLEALVRAADVRASQIAAPLDPRLPRDLVEVQSAPNCQDQDTHLRKWIEDSLAVATTQPDGAGTRPQSAKQASVKSVRAPRKGTRRGV